VTRSACVVAGATPDEVRAFAGGKTGIEVTGNAVGALVTGKPGDLVIDLGLKFEGPVYDVMWNATTGWFAVTIYRGEDVTRWDNRADANPGYPRVPDVLGATTPRAILAALDVAPDVIGYAVS